MRHQKIYAFTIAAVLFVGALCPSLSQSQDNKVKFTTKQLVSLLRDTQISQASTERPTLMTAIRMAVTNAITFPHLLPNQAKLMTDAEFSIAHDVELTAQGSRQPYDKWVSFFERVEPLASKVPGLAEVASWTKASYHVVEPTINQYLDRRQAVLTETQAQTLFNAYGKESDDQFLANLDKFMAQNPQAAQAIEAHLKAEIGFNTASSLSDIKKSVAGLRPLIDQILQYQQADGTFAIPVAKLMDLQAQDHQLIVALTEDARASAVSLDALQKDFKSWVVDQKRQADEQAKIERREQQFQLAQNSVYLLSRLVGLTGNSRLANDISKYGNIALKVGRGVNTLVKVINAFKGGAQGAQVGGWPGALIGAGVELLGLFDGQNDPNAVILQELEQIKEQISALREEMIDRFNRLDMELNQMMDALTTRLDLIDFKLGVLNGNVLEVQKALLEEQANLSRIEQNLYEFLDDVNRQPLSLAINKYLDYTDNFQGRPMSFLEFLDGENTFYTYGASSSLLAVHAGPTDPSYADRDILTELMAFPLLKNVNYLAVFPYARLDLNPLAYTRLGNAELWGLSIDAYRRLALENPVFAATVKVGRRQILRSVGASLQAAVQHIALIPTAKGMAANYALFDSLLGLYRSKVAPIQSETENLLTQYRTEKGIDPSVDLWGKPDQTTNFTESFFRTGDGKLHPVDGTPWVINHANGSQYPLPLPGVLHDQVPKCLIVAEALGLGKLTYAYYQEWYNWHGTNVPQGHNCAKLRFHFLGYWNGVQVLDWVAPCKFEASYTFTGHHDTWPITSHSDFYFDFFDGGGKWWDMRTTVYHWWWGEGTDWWQGIANTRMTPSLQNNAGTLCTLSADDSKIATVRNQVAAALQQHQANFYQRVLDNLSGVSTLERLVEQLTGTKRLIDSYVALGLSKHLETVDYLRALMYGDTQQRVVDGDVLYDLYSKALAEVNRGQTVAKVDISPIVTRQADAVASQIKIILDDIQKSQVADGLRLVDSSLQNFDLLETQLIAPTIDVTKSVRITQGRPMLDRQTGRITQRILIQNISGRPITGPVSYVLDSLNPNMSLYLEHGTTQYLSPFNSPFLNIDVGATNTLAAGGSATLTLEFIATNSSQVQYQPRVLAGLTDR